jgi:hypothetical protein
MPSVPRDRDWIRSHFGTFVGILEDLLAGKLHSMSQDIGAHDADTAG